MENEQEGPTLPAGFRSRREHALFCGTLRPDRAHVRNASAEEIAGITDLIHRDPQEGVPAQALE